MIYKRAGTQRLLKRGFLYLVPSSFHGAHTSQQSVDMQMLLFPPASSCHAQAGRWLVYLLSAPER